MKAGNKRHRIFFIISLLIVTFYFLGNRVVVLGWGPIFSGHALEIYSAVSDVVLFIDLTTWHIYGLFAIISLVIKIVFLWERKINCNALQIINLILHLTFSLISFYDIWFTFKNGF